LNQDIIYRSRYLKIFSNGASHPRLGTVVICFQYRRPDQHLDLPGFAEEFFDRFQVAAVFVNCATNEWYQYQDLPEALATLRAFVSAWARIVTYGSSMGGYAALRFASAVGAKRTIAVGPQYSPRSLVVAGDNRYDALVAQTQFLHEDSYRASAALDNYVVYDPLLKMDERHMMEYRKEANVVPIRIPCGGHTPTILLAQCGLLSDFILDLIAGTFCALRFRHVFRRARTSSPEYWKELVDRLLERGRRETAQRVVEISRVCEKQRRLDRVDSDLAGAELPILDVENAGVESSHIWPVGDGNECGLG